MYNKLPLIHYNWIRRLTNGYYVTHPPSCDACEILFPYLPASFMVKVTLSSPLKKISRNSIGQLPRRPSLFCYFLLLLFFFGLGLYFNRSLMLSWVSLYLPSQWTSADFQTGKGMNRNGSNLFFEFFFSNNINFTAFYGYHRTITLWFHLFHSIFCYENLLQRCLEKTSAFHSLNEPPTSEFFFFFQVWN